MEKINDLSNGDIQVQIAAIAYALYLQAGSPHGNSVAGFDSWYKISVRGKFAKWATEEAEKSYYKNVD